MRMPRTEGVLEHQQVSVRTKLAAAWTSLVFLYAYVDILSLYRPGVIEDILAGVVWKLAITQVWAVGALILMAIPIAMVALSTTLPARACRVTTLGVVRQPTSSTSPGPTTSPSAQRWRSPSLRWSSALHGLGPASSPQIAPPGPSRRLSTLAP